MCTAANERRRAVEVREGDELSATAVDVTRVHSGDRVRNGAEGEPPVVALERRERARLDDFRTALRNDARFRT